MPPRTKSTTNSPPTEPVNEKISNGRISKPTRVKTEGPKDLLEPMKIDDKKFACDGCKNGHRVKHCDHAKDRYLSITNRSGRPGGEEKRKCDCPKSCSCVGKCDCEREECTCTRIMYRLVFVSFNKQTTIDGLALKGTGKWEIEKQVITDIKGQKLDEDQIKALNEKRQKRIEENKNKKDYTSKFQLPSDPPRVLSADGKRILEDDRGHHECCRQAKLAMENSVEGGFFTTGDGNKVPTNLKCCCGPGCQCAFCVDHPNNETSHNLMHEQATDLHFNLVWPNSAQMPHTDLSSLPQPMMSMPASCTGTSPQFGWTNNPNPSTSDLQNVFNHDDQTQSGYYLSYPVYFSQNSTSELEPANSHEATPIPPSGLSLTRGNTSNDINGYHLSSSLILQALEAIRC